MPRIPREMNHESHIHIGNHWYEKPVFVGIGFAVIVVACFFIGETTYTKDRVGAGATVQAAPVAAKVLKVAAVGDSNTAGTGVDETLRSTLSYPAQLQDKLGGLYTVTNFGVSGATLMTGTDTPYTLQESFEKSLASNPDIVLIMLGTNDVRTQKWDAEEYKKQFIAFIGNYKKQENSPKVYLLTPPALFTDAPAMAHLKNEAIPEVYSIAEATGVEVIDIYSATKEHKELVRDGVHPNAEGYEIIAQTVYARLMR